VIARGRPQSAVELGEFSTSRHPGAAWRTPRPGCPGLLLVRRAGWQRLSGEVSAECSRCVHDREGAAWLRWIPPNRRLLRHFGWQGISCWSGGTATTSPTETSTGRIHRVQLGAGLVRRGRGHRAHRVPPGLWIVEEDGSESATPSPRCPPGRTGWRTGCARWASRAVIV